MNFYENNFPLKSKIILICKNYSTATTAHPTGKSTDRKTARTVTISLSEETPEDESTTILSEETESIEKHTKKKQKWWQLWK